MPGLSDGERGTTAARVVTGRAGGGVARVRPEGRRKNEFPRGQRPGERRAELATGVNCIPVMSREGSLAILGIASSSMPMKVAGSALGVDTCRVHPWIVGLFDIMFLPGMVWSTLPRVSSVPCMGWRR